MMLRCTDLYCFSHPSVIPVTFQEKPDGTPGDLLIKQAHSNQATIQATDDYAQRVSIDDKYNLLITQATLKDQKIYTCMVVSDVNLMEYSVTVFVSSKFNTDSIVWHVGPIAHTSYQINAKAAAAQGWQTKVCNR